MRKIDRLKKRFIVEGLEVALQGRKRSRIYAKKADGDFEVHLAALSCSEPPECFTRWPLRLLTDKVVEFDYIGSISQETKRRVLKKRNQALATNRMGNSTGIKQHFRGADTDGAGCLQTPLRFPASSCLHGRISQATDSGEESTHSPIPWTVGKIQL